MSIDRDIAQFATRHHGVVTRRAALEAGMTDRAIQRRLESGVWARASNGVYVIAGSVDTFARRVSAAILSTDGGRASLATAGRLLGMRYLGGDRRIHLVVPDRCSRRSALAVMHRWGDLATADMAMVDALPVTSAARTIFDLAAMLHRPRLSQVLDDALDRRLVTWADLEACCARYARRGRPGAAAFRSAVAERGDGLIVTESVLERRFVAFCRVRGLPTPVLQLRLHWRDRVIGRVDCAFVAQRLIVELDGRRGHSQLTHQDRDKIRAQEAGAMGWQTMQVTWAQLHDGPDALEARLRATLDQRRSRSA